MTVRASFRRFAPRGVLLGLTLIEMMVGLAIGLFLLTVMGAIFFGSRNTFGSQMHVARLQESARFALDTLAADLRVAGFRGCRGAANDTPLNSVLNTPSGFLYRFSEGVWASHAQAGAWAPALDSTLTAPNLSPAPWSGGDVLTVRRPVGTGWSLTAEMSSGTSAVPISQGSAITARDLLMISDCSGATYFQASNATPGASGSIEHSSVAAMTPGLSSSDLGRAYLQDAVVQRMATTTYYLAASARTGRDGLRSLWSYTTPNYDGTPQPQELITGVEGLVVRLGLDTNADGAVDAQARPADVADWTQVLSVQLDVLLVSPNDGVTASAQPYAFDGRTVTPTDRRLRIVASTSVSLRNAVR